MKILQCKKIWIFLLILFGCISVSVVNAAENYLKPMVVIPYIAPGVNYYPPSKSYKIEKININTATLEQLLILPNFNEDLALKVMLIRPIKALEDLYVLPYLNKERVKIIIKGINHLVTQPLELPSKSILKQ